MSVATSAGDVCVRARSAAARKRGAGQVLGGFLTRRAGARRERLKLGARANDVRAKCARVLACCMLTCLYVHAEALS